MPAKLQHPLSSGLSRSGNKQGRMQLQQKSPKCGYSTVVSAPACHAGDESSILSTRSKSISSFSIVVVRRLGKA